MRRSIAPRFRDGQPSAAWTSALTAFVAERRAWRRTRRESIERSTSRRFIRFCVRVRSETIPLRFTYLGLNLSLAYQWTWLERTIGTAMVGIGFQ